jgi:Arc/MetJ-type ribon-helix-helix transcriptional regulator
MVIVVGFHTIEATENPTRTEQNAMKTIQMTLDEELVSAVDSAVQKLGTSRSAFTRQALRQALTKIEERDLERRQREGYLRHPVEPGEFSDWEDEQVWVD